MSQEKWFKTNDYAGMIKSKREELNNSLVKLEKILQKQKDNNVVVTLDVHTSSFIIYNSLTNMIEEINTLVESENNYESRHKGYCVAL